MQYFTSLWWQSCQIQPVSEESHLPGKQYREYFASVETQLPARFLEFTKSFSLHDAGLVRFEVDMQAKQLRVSWLISVCGLRQPMRDEKVTFIYSGLKSFVCTESIETTLPGPGGHGDLGYDEIELLNPSLFEHRMLFSSGIEWSLRFEEFDYLVEA